VPLADAGLDTGLNKPASVPDWLPPFLPIGFAEKAKAIGHDDERRILIAICNGLEGVASEDQYIHAILEIGIDNPQDADCAHLQIEGILAAFQIRSFPTKQSPTPTNIIDSIEKIADALNRIDFELSIISMARNGVGINDHNRQKSLKFVHEEILKSILNRALPATLASKFTESEIEQAMPIKFRDQNTWIMSDPWNCRFSLAASSIRNIAERINGAELASPSRQPDVDFVSFISRLGTIFQQWTGTVPASPDPNSNQNDDWRGPFGRFVAAVWPLTPEGSGGLGESRDCPSNKRIRKALKQSALLASRQKA
jgi:hypothetical protein